MGGGVSRAFGVEGQWGLVHRSCTELGETETPLLEGVHQVSCALGLRSKQGLHKNLGQTYLQVLEGPLGKQEMAVSCYKE